MKLNQDDVKRLRDAYREFLDRKDPIIRTFENGELVVLSNVEEIGRWGGGRTAVVERRGISRGRLYELRNNGWKLKRGVDPNLAVSDESDHGGDQVSGDVFRALYQSSLEEISRRERRLGELEAELAGLRRRLEE